MSAFFTCLCRAALTYQESLLRPVQGAGLGRWPSVWEAGRAASGLSHVWEGLVELCRAHVGAGVAGPRGAGLAGPPYLTW